MFCQSQHFQSEHCHIGNSWSVARGTGTRATPVHCPLTLEPFILTYNSTSPSQCVCVYYYTSFGMPYTLGVTPDFHLASHGGISSIFCGCPASSAGVQVELLQCHWFSHSYMVLLQELYYVTKLKKRKCVDLGVLHKYMGFFFFSGFSVAFCTNEEKVICDQL